MLSLPLAKKFRREQYNYNFAGAKLSKVFFFTLLSRERRNVEKQFAQQDGILGFGNVTKNELNTGKEMSSVKLRKIVFFIYCTYCNVMIYLIILSFVQLACGILTWLENGIPDTKQLKKNLK